MGDTPLDALQDISEWLNIDQNENQVTHLCQIVKQIQTVAKKQYELAKEVKLMTIVQKVMNGVGVTLLLQVVSSLTRYVTEQGAGRYVDALCDWHSASVNAGELGIAHTLVEEVGKQIPTRFVLCKVAIPMVQYNGLEKKKSG